MHAWPEMRDGTYRLALIECAARCSRRDCLLFIVPSASLEVQYFGLPTYQVEELHDRLLELRIDGGYEIRHWGCRLLHVHILQHREPGP